MIRGQLLCATAALCLCVAPSLHASDPAGPAPPQPDSPDKSSDILLVDTVHSDNLPAWLQLGGQIRGRFEDPSGTSITNAASDAYYLSRIRMDLGIKADRWLRFFAEAQDARVAAYNISPAPSAIYNPLDLRQGFVEVKLEGTANITARAGRQELAFGGERLIGPADWGMSRTFHAVDVGISHGRAKVDLFGGSVVLIDPTRIDRHKPGEHIYGAYGSIKNVLPGMNIEPYTLFKQTLQVKSELAVTGDALIASPGVRVFGTARARFDYIVEVVVQRGTYSTNKVAAMGASLVAGWTISRSPHKPRLSLEYNYASGDRSSKDGTRNTFDQLYPSDHPNYGMIDQFGWQNMKNIRAGFDLLVTKKLKLRTDFNDFYLATVQDALYNSSGSPVVLNRKATSSHVGSEINNVALYQWSKIWHFGAGYGHLFAGEYLKQSKAAFGYTYPYLMFVGNF
jgi:hypothetical protein